MAREFKKLLSGLVFLVWTLIMVSGCSFSGDIVNLDQAVVVQKKIYIDTTAVTLSEGSFGLITIAAQEKYDVDTKISILLTGMSGRFQSVPLSVTLPARTLTTSLILQTIDDNIYQGTQNYILSIAAIDSETVVTFPTLNITLNDNDAVPEISIADVSSNEGAGTITFTVTQNRLSIFNSQFQWATTNGTALAGTDFTSVALTTASIPAGALTTTLTVPLLDDTNLEPNKNFLVDLSNCNAYCTIQDNQATGTIVNDDNVPTVQFTLASDSKAESAGTFNIHLELSAASTDVITVPYTISGTATDGTDFSIATASPVSIPAGQTGADISITLTDDALNEAIETVILTLGSPTNAALGTKITHTLSITDNDAQPTLSINSQSVNENAGTVTLTASLSTASGQSISFDWATADGTATQPGDYTQASATTVTFLPGETTKSIIVSVIDDTSGEADETFTVGLSNITAAQSGTTTGTVTILQSDITGIPWTGATGDGKWSTAGNWQGGAVPSAAQTASFYSLFCGANCNVNVDTNINVGGILMDTAYTGTITQATTRTITVGTAGWTQNGGTFVGGNATITSNGPFNFNAGVFTSTSGNLSLNQNVSFPAGGTFNHNNGTLVYGAGNGSNISIDSSHEFNNFTFTGYQAYNRALTGVINVNGNLSMGDGYGPYCNINGGVIKAKGNVNFTSYSLRGTVEIQLVGTGNQTFTNNTGWSNPGVTIDSSGGVVTFTGSSLAFQGNFIHLNGNTDFSGSSVTFFGNTTVQHGPVVFNNVHIYTYTSNFTLSSSMTVLGDFSFGHAYGSSPSWLNGGTYIVHGNVTSTSQGMIGTSTITMVGNNDATISTARADFGGLSGGHFIINKPGAVVTLATNASFNNAGQDFTIQAGTLKLAGHSLTVNDYLTIEAGATLDTGCGTFTPNSGIKFVNNGTLIDGSANPNISISDASGNEGTTLTHTVSLDAPFCGSNLTMNYVSSSGTATNGTDYPNTTGTLTFTPGQTSQSITVATTQDATVEDNETYTITLSAQSAGTLLDATATGSILNEDISAFVWTGTAGDNNWSTGGNWHGGVAPGASDIAIFNNACVGANCNVNMNSNISVAGIYMFSTYAGTITQATTRTITVGTAGWTQNGGTFVGGDSNISTTGAFVLTGGSFTSTSALLGLYAPGLTYSGGTFIHNSGTVTLSGTPHPLFTFNLSSTLTLNNLTWYSQLYNLKVAGGFPLKVAGDFIVNNGGGYGAFDQGEIQVDGNVDLGTTGFLSNYGTCGTFRLTGSGTRNITGAGQGTVACGLVIDAAGGTVNIINGFKLQSSFTYLNGTVNAGTSNIGMYSYYTDFNLISGNMVFNDLTFYEGSQNIIMTGQTVKVGGSLNVNASYQVGTTNGVIEISKDLNLGDKGFYHTTTTLKMVGTGTSTITGSNYAVAPILEIDNGVGTVNATGNFAIKKQFKYTSGTFNATDSSIQFLIYGGFGDVTVNPGPVVFDDVVFKQLGDNSSLDLNGNTLSIGGDLTLDTTDGYYARVKNGTIDVNGNIDLGTQGLGTQVSPLNLIMSGGAAANISGTAAAIFNVDTFNINKPISEVTLTKNLTLARTDSDLTITAGTLKMNGYSLTVNDVLTIEAAGTLDTGCGTFSPNSGIKFVNNGTLIDGSANPNISISDASGNEGTTLTHTVTLDAAFCGSNLTVNYASSSGTATNGTDYPNTTGTLTFTPGQTSQNITVATTQDATVEDNETYNITLSANSAGTLLDNAGVGTILNEDISAFVWTGNAGDNNWSTGGNWYGGAAPGAAAVAIFNNACVGANCNVSINSNISVAGIYMFSTYAGTITQAATRTITVGTSGWVQRAGTFNGGDSAITGTGDFLISGGSFQATSGTMTLTKDFWFTGSATFAHNNGTIFFSLPQTDLVVPNDLYNVSLTSEWSKGINLQGSTASIAGTLNMTMNQLDYPGFSNGTLRIKGDMNVSGYSVTASTVTFEIAGSGNQTIDSTGQSAGKAVRFLHWNLASTGGTTTFKGSFEVYGDFTSNNGNYNLTQSTFIIRNEYGIPSGTVTPGSVQFQNVDLVTTTSVPRTYAAPLIVKGLLNVNDSSKYSIGDYYYYNGVIHAEGDIAINEDSHAFASGQLIVKGSANQNISSLGGSFWNIEINKSGGTLTQTSSNIWVKSNFTHTNGTVNWNGKTLGFTGSATIVPGSISYENVHFAAPGANYNLSGGTMNITGLLTLSNTLGFDYGNGTIGNGTINLSGNLLTDSNGLRGTAVFNLVGTNNQTIDTLGTGTGPRSNWTINKPSGQVQLLSNLALAGTGQDLTLQSGVLDLNGKTLTVNDVFTLNAGTTMYTGCGSYSPNSGAKFINNGTIVDGTNGVTLSIADVSADEGTDLNFIVSLSGGTNCKDIPITYNTSNGTASAGVNYTAVSGGSVTLTTGQSTASITISTLDDNTYVGTGKTLNLTLSGITTTAVTDNVAVGTINDTDPPPPGPFNITGIQSSNSLDSTLDAFLNKDDNASVSWDTSLNSTSYDVTIYEDDGSTIKCATQTTVSTSYDFSACNLTLGSYYKVGVVATDGFATRNATNNLYRFLVNRDPTITASGPWYVLASGSITIDAQYAAPPSVGVGTDPDAGQTLSIAAIAPVNVAAAANGASVTASSTLDATNYPASAVIDGDRRGLNYGTGGAWHDNTNAVFSDWVEIQFSGTKSITSVVVYSLQDNYSSPAPPSDNMQFSSYGLVDYDVQYWDGSAWQTVPNGNVRANYFVRNIITFPSVNTSKIRILTLSSANHDYSRITEVEAYESQLPLIHGSTNAGGTSLIYTPFGSSSNGVETIPVLITDGAGGSTTANIQVYVVQPHTWTGNAGTNTWSTAGNWCGTINANKNGCTGTGTVPDSSHVVVIDDTCQSGFCNPVISANTSLAGIIITANSLTQGAGATLTTGSSGFVQTGGTFTGGDANITFSSGGVFISGASSNFQLTSATTAVSTHFNVGTINSFSHNNGNFVMNGFQVYGFVGRLTTGANQLYNLDFISGYAVSDYIGYSGVSVANQLRSQQGGGGTSLAVWGPGTITLQGNLVLEYSFSCNYDDCADLKLTGNSQTISATANQRSLPLEIASSGTVQYLSDFTIMNQYKHTSGTVDTGTTNISFAVGGFYGASFGSINVSSIQHHNFTLIGNYYAMTHLTGTLYVNNDLTLTSANGTHGILIDSGTIDIGRNLVATAAGAGLSDNWGTASSIVFSGNTSATINLVTGGYFSVLQMTINKSGGATVSLLNELTMLKTYYQPQADLIINPGNTFDMAGYNLTVGRHLANNGTLLKGSSPTCGTLTVNGTFSGNAATCP